jgi:hypothetical protein
LYLKIYFTRPRLEAKERAISKLLVKKKKKKKSGERKRARRLYELLVAL